jgi:hypothetical protein
MRVICIRKCNFATFTIEPGEWLEVYDEEVHPLTPLAVAKELRKSYTFERNGYELFCKKDHFITIQQWREQQLNTLLNESL